MSFTYSLATDRGKIRLNLGDTVQNKGPRPDKRNFSDDEIDYFVSSESDNVEAATARGFETLASEWTSYSLSEREGDVSFDAKGMANLYKARAGEWWGKSGRSTTNAPTFSEHQIIYHLGYGDA